MVTAAREAESGPRVSSAPGTFDQLPAALVQERALLEFIVKVSAMAGVQRLAFCSGNREVELWVLMREESLQDEERIYRLEREFRRQSATAHYLDIHVLPLNRINEDALPPAEFVIELS